MSEVTEEKKKKKKFKGETGEDSVTASETKTDANESQLVHENSTEPVHAPKKKKKKKKSTGDDLVNADGGSVKNMGLEESNVLHEATTDQGDVPKKKRKKKKKKQNVEDIAAEEVIVVAVAEEHSGGKSDLMNQTKVDATNVSKANSKVKVEESSGEEQVEEDNNKPGATMSLAEIKTIIYNVFTMDGRMFYKQLLAPPDPKMHWLWKFFISFYYGKYVQYPRYTKKDTKSVKATIYRFHFMFGLLIEVLMMLLSLLAIGHSVAMSVWASVGMSDGLWLLFMVFLPLYAIDFFYGVVVTISRLTIFIAGKRDYPDIDFIDYLGTRSYLETPDRVKKMIKVFSESKVGKIIWFEVWFPFLCVRGFGNAFHLHSIHDAIFIYIVNIKNMDITTAKTSFAFGIISFTYVLACLYAMIVLVCTRFYYYFFKELEYIVKLDTVHKDIKRARKSKTPDEIYIETKMQERDKIAWRMRKQKLGPKLKDTWPMFSGIFFQYLQVVASACAAVGSGTDVEDYVFLSLGLMFQIIQPFCLMTEATKSPIFTRIFLTLLERVPVSAPGYMFYRWLHSKYVQDLPSIPANFILFASSVVSFIAGGFDNVFGVPVLLILWLITIPGMLVGGFNLFWMSIYPIWFSYVLIKYRKYKPPKFEGEISSSEEEKEEVKVIEAPPKKKKKKTKKVQEEDRNLPVEGVPPNVTKDNGDVVQDVLFVPVIVNTVEKSDAVATTTSVEVVPEVVQPSVTDQKQDVKSVVPGHLVGEPVPQAQENHMDLVQPTSKVSKPMIRKETMVAVEKNVVSTVNNLTDSLSVGWKSVLRSGKQVKKDEIVIVKLTPQENHFNPESMSIVFTQLQSMKVDSDQIRGILNDLLLIRDQIAPSETQNVFSCDPVEVRVLYDEVNKKELNDMKISEVLSNLVKKGVVDPPIVKIESVSRKSNRDQASSTKLVETILQNLDEKLAKTMELLEKYLNVPPPVQETNVTKLEKLERLIDLKEKGTITNEEFLVFKKDLMMI